MTEPEQIEFTERIDRPILTRGLARGGIVLGSALLLVVGVMSAMGASPAPVDRCVTRRREPRPSRPPRTATRSPAAVAASASGGTATAAPAASASVSAA